jgi:hypothetical protein
MRVVQRSLEVPLEQQLASKQLPELTQALQQQLAATQRELAATQVHASAAHNHALNMQKRVRRLVQQLAAAQAAAAQNRQEPQLTLRPLQQQQLQAEDEDALLALLCGEDGVSLATNSSQQHMQCNEPGSAAQGTGSATVPVAVEQKLGLSEPLALSAKEEALARDADAAVVGSHDAAAATSRGLGPAGLALVKQEVGALPSQQQLQYWQQADRPFDAAYLQVLLQQFMMPRQVKTLAGRANRSGRARPALVDVADRVTQQYAVLAPTLYGLLLQVQQEQQRLGISSSIGAGQKTANSQTNKRKRTAPQQLSAAAVYAKSAAAVVLLRALRCLQLWESRMVSQPDMPTLLQRLAGRGSAAAAPAGSTAAVEVEEFVDLTGGDDDAEMDGDAAAAAEQLQAFLVGEVDLLLVREQGRAKKGAVGLGAAAAVVKMEAEVSD